MLLSVHIPKTAGVSFRKMLSQLYGPGFVQYYWEISDAWGRIRSDVPPEATCIHGHFAAHVLADRYPEASLVTWVRDPVERVASSYYYRLRSPDWRHPVSIELHEKHLSLVEYAALDEVRNEMTRFFGERQPDDFAFIGLVEEFGVSMEKFLEQFDLPAMPIPRENTNPYRRAPLYEMGDDERQQILELNQLDWNLYNTCLGRQERQLSLAETG